MTKELIPQNVTNYWYCYVYGSDGPKVRHTSYEDAEREARRITEKWGKEVEILRLVAISQVKASIKSFEIPLSSVDKKKEADNE